MFHAVENVLRHMIRKTFAKFTPNSKEIMVFPAIVYSEKIQLYSTNGKKTTHKIKDEQQS